MNAERLARVSVNQAAEPRLDAEVEEKADFDVRGSQGVQALSDVIRLDRSHRLRLNDHALLGEEVCPKAR